jgi:hypothetical protein
LRERFDETSVAGIDPISEPIGVVVVVIVDHKVYLWGYTTNCIVKQR